jgi:hypothetical protein
MKGTISVYLGTLAGHLTSHADGSGATKTVLWGLGRKHHVCPQINTPCNPNDPLW